MESSRNVYAERTLKGRPLNVGSEAMGSVAAICARDAASAAESALGIASIESSTIA